MGRRKLFTSVVAVCTGWFASFFPPQTQAWTPWDGLDEIVRRYNEMPAERFRTREKARIVKCEYISGNNHLDDDEIRIKIDRGIGELAFAAVFYREPMPKHDAEIRESIRDMKARGIW